MATTECIAYPPPAPDDQPTERAGVTVVARWRTCLHEAGHAVVGRALLGHTTRAAVFDDGWGVADVGDGGGVPVSDESAFAVAAGPAAESLAEDYPHPQTAASQPLEIRYPATSVCVKARAEAAMTDDVALARWCIAGFESRPLRWSRRYDWVYEQADALIARHEVEIVAVATSLFTCGIATLPADLIPTR